jgi:hypothetical protein
MQKFESLLRVCSHVKALEIKKKPIECSCFTVGLGWLNDTFNAKDKRNGAHNAAKGRDESSWEGRLRAREEEKLAIAANNNEVTYARS